MRSLGDSVYELDVHKIDKNWHVIPGLSGKIGRDCGSVTVVDVTVVRVAF